MQIFDVIIIALAIIGLFVCIEVYRKKRDEKSRPFVCPLNFNCEAVVHSKYSKFFGIPLEIVGIVYYSFLILAYLVINLLSFIIPESLHTLFAFTMIGISTAAFCMSIYLTLVQALYIKDWCSWCLTSAFLSTCIFVLATTSAVVADLSIIPILAEYKQIILLAHMFGFALGVGGATFTDVLFFRFLKDFRISKEEASALTAVSQVIWIGIFLTLISGLGLYLPEAEALNHNAKFIAKAIIVGIIVINGTLLNILVSPRLVDLSFNNNTLSVQKVQSLRRLAFVLGSISIVSWYTTFILGAIETTVFSVLEILLMYLTVICIAIAIGQLLERFWYRRSSVSN